MAAAAAAAENVARAAVVCAAGDEARATVDDAAAGVAGFGPTAAILWVWGRVSGEEKTSSGWSALGMLLPLPILLTLGRR